MKDVWKKSGREKEREGILMKYRDGMRGMVEGERDI